MKKVLKNAVKPCRGTFVSREDSECWLILFAQVYRIFSWILKNKNLFQISGQTGSYNQGGGGGGGGQV